MSDYYGNADLQDWLYEEVFDNVPNLKKSEDVPVEVVRMFEFWRESVERNIESWFDSDDGDGPASWRDWGRGFYALGPEGECPIFDKLTVIAETYMKFDPVIDECDSGHKFAKLKDHPVSDDGRPRCPYCMSIGIDKLKQEVEEVLTRSSENYSTFRPVAINLTADEDDNK